ncbi:MAG: PAAR-like domain-containing protein [Burkholderiaceae bacterium]
MFANCQLMGIDLAFPDICKTPPALIPIPYPNFALGPMAIPNAWNILIMGMPAHNLLTTIPLTNGDNPGLALGLISPSVMGPSRHVTCVPNVLFKCIPATRLTSMTVQNRSNAVGMRIVPSQIKVVLLGGGGGGGAASRAGKGAGAAGKASKARKGGPGRAAKGGKNAKRADGKQAGKPPRKKSLREQYMGRTPGKNSRTGRQVQKNMREKGRLRENRRGETEFKASDDKWYPLREADMAHSPKDAVGWWNQTGRALGPKSPGVRKWMRDADNYVLDHFSLNRSAGAKLGTRYLPPLP